MIQLLNRRFVNFYYNTGGPGLGKDPAAAAFTRGKTRNVYAFYAAFDPAGDPVGVTDIYADKDNVFDFLVALLRANPEFDAFTKEEDAILARAKAAPADAAARLAAGQLLEELGRYAEAEPHYRAALPTAAALRGLMRMARYRRDWPVLRTWCERAVAPELAADVAMESAFALLAEKKYADVRRALESAIAAHPTSKRRSELHFYAGVACFFLSDTDRAYYHWCWVVENLPDDRLARRCYTAAAHRGMPYANPELGGFSADLRGGNIGVIQAAYARAKAVYERQNRRD